MIRARETRGITAGKIAPLWKSAAINSSSSGLQCYSAAVVGQTVPSLQGSFRISCSRPADRLQCLGYLRSSSTGTWLMTVGCVVSSDCANLVGISTLIQEAREQIMGSLPSAFIIFLRSPPPPRGSTIIIFLSFLSRDCYNNNT